LQLATLVGFFFSSSSLVISSYNSKLLPKCIERATDRTRARTRARNDSRTLFYAY